MRTGFRRRIPVRKIGWAIAIYSLAWGGVFTLALSYPYDHMLPETFATEAPISQILDVLAVPLSLALGMVVIAAGAVPLAALHLALTAGMSRWSRRPAVMGLASAALGLLGGLLLFLLWHRPGMLLYAGFDYFTPPLAVPALVASAVAGASVGAFLTRRPRRAIPVTTGWAQEKTWPPPPDLPAA